MAARRRPPRPAAAAVLAAVSVTAAAALLAGCGGQGQPEHSPADRSLPPAELCTRAVVYWAGQMLSAKDDKGFDYQEMGLSDSQNEILRDLVARARKSGDPDLPKREAPQRCRDLARQKSSGVPSQGPWPG